jgi:endonuclease/exonuclease/phosphatase family metal-dependent hydrolase
VPVLKIPALFVLLWACMLATTPAKAQSVELRLVSYNVYLVPYTAPARAERLERLPGKIAELQPDVVMLQEVWSETDSASLERALRGHGLAHVVRDASNAPFAYDSTGMIIASRFPITDRKGYDFALGRRPHTPYHLDWIGKKGALEVQVQTPLGALRFVNTHFQASYATGSYEAVRVAQSLELADWLRDQSQPLVLGGDFNARPDWPSSKVLRDRSGVRLPEGSWRVDHVLLRDGEDIAVESVEMERLLHEPVALSDGSQRRLSDHRAVLMRLKLSKKPKHGAAAPTGPDSALIDEAKAVLLSDLQRTTRQKHASYFALTGSLLGLGWAARRRVKHQHATRSRRAAVLAIACGLTAIWLAYFLVGYVPHRMAGIESALLTLAKT